MSIIGSISNCRKPIANGSDRDVFYSKRYNCIIKKNRSFSTYRDFGVQTKNELRIFSEMTEEEKEVYPIIDIIDYKGEDVVLMKKCLPIMNLPIIRDDYYEEHGVMADDEESLSTICDYLGIDESNIYRVLHFIEKYGLQDIHIANLGLLNEKLVILDAGA